MSFFNCVVEHGAASVVLLERGGLLFDQKLDDFGVASAARVYKRSTAFGTRLVDFGATSLHQELDSLDVALYRRAVQRC